VLRRSTDGGCSWGPQQLVADHGTNTIGNPAPVVDPASGDVVLLSVRNGPVTEAQILRGEASPENSRRVFVQRSTDDGHTFSEPLELTSAVKLPDWRWYATTPGHGIALRSGRLLIPANHSIAPPAGSTDTGAEAKYYGRPQPVLRRRGPHLADRVRRRQARRLHQRERVDGGPVARWTGLLQHPRPQRHRTGQPRRRVLPGRREDLQKPFRPQATLIGPVVQASVLSLKDLLVYSGPADRRRALR